MALTQASEGGLKISNAGTNGQYLQKQSGNTGGLTWADVSSIGGATGVDFNDNVKIRFGTGNDLEIFHDGTDSKIDNSQGDVLIRAGGGNIHIRPVNAENSILARPNGAVELYHDNSKKFETMSTGAYVEGYLAFPDNGGLKVGSSNDLQIYHDGSSSYVYDDGTGPLILGTNNSNVQIKGAGSAAHMMAEFKSTEGVDLYYNNTKVFATTNGGVHMGDSKKLYIGDGNDVEIFHDGSNSRIKNTTGYLILQSSTGILLKNDTDDENFIVANDDGSVELCHNGTKMLETTTLGTMVSGRLLATSTALDPDNDAFDGTDYPLVVQNPENDNGDSTGIAFAVTTSATNVGAAIHHVRTGGGSQGDMRFLTSSDGNSITERARITDSGRFFISTTSDTINQSNFGTSIRDGRIKTSHNVSGSNVVLNVYGNGTADGFRVMGDGDCQNANNSYSSTSDETLKQDIVDAASQWEDIKALKVKKFRFKSNPSAPLQIGVIAQDLEKVSPGLVKEVVLDDEKPDEKVKTVKYSVLYMKAIKALQEAMAKIETLETKVAALEAA